MHEPTDEPDDKQPRQKNQAAAELGRRGGMKGGLARAARMTPEERANAARLAASVRWARIREVGEELEKPDPRHRLFEFILEPEEVAFITETTIAGKGGLQTLQRKLREQLSQSNIVRFDNLGLGQLIRYMAQYRDGGFQRRLRHAFERSLRKLLDF